MESKFFLKIIGVLGALLLCLLCLWQWESVPGLHSDEAWAILDSVKIFGGSFRIDGTDNYTGALPVFLIASLTKLTGDSLFASKLLGALCAAGAFICLWLGLQATLVSPVGIDQRRRWTAIFTVLALATSPVLVCYFRFSTDITSVVPMLVCGAICASLYGVSARRWPQAVGWSLVSALLATTAMHTHFLAVASVLALIVALLLCFKRRGVYQAAVIASGLAMILCYRLEALKDHGVKSSSSALMGVMDKLNFEALTKAVQAVSQIISGEIPAKRFAGGLVWHDTHITAIALFLVAVATLVMPRNVRNPAANLLITLSPLTAMFTLLMVPYIAERYFLLPAIFLLFGLLGRIPSSSDVVREKARAFRTWSAAAVGCLFVFNATFLWVNYFHLFMRTGGSTSAFTISKDFSGESAHFIDLRPTIATLKALNPVTVYLQDFIDRPARVLFPRYQLAPPLVFLGYGDLESGAISKLKPGEAAVLYRSTRISPEGMKKIAANNGFCRYREKELTNTVVVYCE